MTGKELYELSARGYKHDPFELLDPLLQQYYEEQAGIRRRDNHIKQRESFYEEESLYSGWGTER